MKRTIIRVFLAGALAALVAVPTGAEELTVKSILAAQQAGAPADGIVAMVDNPANTVAMTAGDIVTLRDAGVPESVITAVRSRVPASVPAPQSLQPDDGRLVDFVRLTKSGMSEPIIIEQLRQEDQAYSLSVNDLLYLKENGVLESTIAALMATSTGAPAVAPAELVFEDLVLVNRGFWRKDSVGRMVMRGDTLSWENPRDPQKNFTFQTAGLDKVWLTCEARSSGSFCHQINFKIVKGDRYRFQDRQRETGSNAAVLEVMEALRKYHPSLSFSTPSVGD